MSRELIHGSGSRRAAMLADCASCVTSSGDCLTGTAFYVTMGVMNDQTSAVQLSQIGQISVNVRDLDRAVNFYQQTLGMTLQFHVPKMAFFACGSVRLMLAIAEKPEFDHPASVIYYKVADLPAVHAILAARHVKFEAQPHLVAKMPDHDLWMAFLRDSEGNLLGLMSEVRGSKT
jgi:predicted enzyme related to lactoylglutathione lyase